MSKGTLTLILTINGAWASRVETAAAILNAIDGWRLEETRRRSHHRTLHYFDKSCPQSRIDRAPLNAMLEATYKQHHLGQRALNAMGKLLDIQQA